MFERIVNFAPAFSKGGDHSDTELLIRLFRSRGQALYVPTILVTADVQPERLRKKYHRRWAFKAGRAQALLRFLEIFNREGRLTEPSAVADTLFGVPASAYRALLSESAGWLGAKVRRRESVAMTHENRLHYLAGYISRRYEQTRGERSRWRIAEVWMFATSVLKRKVRKLTPRSRLD
jgi:hypothetical protein